MGNKIFSVVVLLLWGSTMTWLFSAKIVPHIFHGEPPVTTLASDDEPVAWRISLNGRPSGTAITQSTPGTVGSTEVHSLLRLESIPLPDVAPEWMNGLLSRLGEVSLNMRTRTTLDPFGNLATFETRIEVNDTPELITTSGVVLGDRLRLRLKSGEFTKSGEYPWRSDCSLAGELMPACRLTNLHVGKTWRTKVYNPFGPPNTPVSLIEAEVVSFDEIGYGGVVAPMYHIEYRSVSSAGVSLADRIRSEVWVTEDGRVVRQRVAFLNARLFFERLDPEESSRLADSMLELDRYASTTAPPSRGEAGRARRFQATHD